MLSDITYVFLISLVGALILTPLVRLFALKYKILDKPGKRRVHSKPTPTLGGLAIFIPFILGVLFAFFYNPLFREEFVLIVTDSYDTEANKT